MSRRTWGLFTLVGFLWGIPYLFIRVAVDPENGFHPANVVFLRVAIGAAFLLPIALKEKSLSFVMRNIKWVFVYALFEMVGPWILIGTAEQKIPSGLAGLLVASVPIWASILASLDGDKTVWHKSRLAGMLIGFVGLILVVGIESISGTSDPLSIAMMLLASMGYAFAIYTINRKVPSASGMAINAVAMVITGIIYLPFMFIAWPSHAISTQAVLSVIALGLFSTAAAFALFFKLFREIGPARASLVTYLNTAFAVVLGVIILNEPLTIGIVLGLPLVLFGSYLAGRKPATVR